MLKQIKLLPYRGVRLIREHPFAAGGFISWGVLTGVIKHVGADALFGAINSWIFGMLPDWLVNFLSQYLLSAFLSLLVIGFAFVLGLRFANSSTAQPKVPPRQEEAVAQKGVGAGWEPTPAFDVRPKIEAIDRALNVLRTDFPKALQKGKDLWGKTEVEIKAGRVTAYMMELSEGRDEWRAAAENLVEIRMLNERFDDLFTLLKQPLKSKLTHAWNHLITMISALGDEPEKTRFNFILEPHRRELKDALDETRNWARETEQALLHRRREVANTDATPQEAHHAR